MTASDLNNRSIAIPALSFDEALRVLGSRLATRIADASTQIDHINQALSHHRCAGMSWSEAQERIREACLQLYDFSMLLQTIDFRGYAECAQAKELAQTQPIDQEAS